MLVSAQVLDDIAHSLDGIMDCISMLHQRVAALEHPEESLASKVERGAAHVMGVNADGSVCIAEVKPVFGETAAGAWVPEEEADPEDVLADQRRINEERNAKATRALDREDDGAVPSPDEVATVLRAGVCDSVELVGTPVVYQSDGRGGKHYRLPAVVTVVQRSHPDLPSLRAAQEATGYDDIPKLVREGWSPGQVRVALQQHGVKKLLDGWVVEPNPVPIPLDGTVHLKVHTPGPKGSYDEWSVPYDPSGKPRTWRYLDGHQPL